MLSVDVERKSVAALAALAHLRAAHPDLATTLPDDDDLAYAQLPARVEPLLRHPDFAARAGAHVALALAATPYLTASAVEDLARLAATLPDDTPATFLRYAAIVRERLCIDALVASDDPALRTACAHAHAALAVR